MSSEEILKAIRLSHLENELETVLRQIKLHEAAINSHRTFYKSKEDSKKVLLKLARQKLLLIDQIAEASLLDG